MLMSTHFCEGFDSITLFHFNNSVALSLSLLTQPVQLHYLETLRNISSLLLYIVVYVYPWNFTSEFWASEVAQS